MADKKLIATTVSSREKGIRRREEGWTMSSQKTISLQRNQNIERCTSEGGGRDKLKKVDSDFPTCMRNSRNNNDDERKNGRPERKMCIGKETVRVRIEQCPLMMTSPTMNMQMTSSYTVDNIRGNVTRYKDVLTVGECTLMPATTWQPVYATIETDQSQFQSYRAFNLRRPLIFKGDDESEGESGESHTVSSSPSLC